VKRAFMLAALLAIAVPGTAQPAQPPAEPSVRTADVSIAGAQGTAPILARATYGQGDRPMPLIVLIPAGRVSAHSSLAQFWADHGFVVIEFAAPGTMNSPGRYGTPRWIDPAEGQDAAAGVGRVLDSLNTVEKSVPDLAGKIDRKRIGIAGNAVGSYAAALVAGVTVQGPEAQQQKTFRDARPLAFLLLSAPARGQGGLTPSSWGHVERPIMTVAEEGRFGRSFGGTDAFDALPAGDKYNVSITPSTSAGRPGGQPGAGGYARGGRGQWQRGGGFGRSGGRVSPAGLEAVEAVSLKFWDAYLKGDADAKKTLTSGTWPQQPEGLSIRVTSK
jgi:hypothetical protein